MPVHLMTSVINKPNSGVSAYLKNDIMFPAKFNDIIPRHEWMKIHLIDAWSRSPFIPLAGSSHLLQVLHTVIAYSDTSH